MFYEIRGNASVLLIKFVNNICIIYMYIMFDYYVCHRNAAQGVEHEMKMKF